MSNLLPRIRSYQVELDDTQARAAMWAFQVAGQVATEQGLVALAIWLLENARRLRDALELEGLLELNRGRLVEGGAA